MVRVGVVKQIKKDINEKPAKRTKESCDGFVVKSRGYQINKRSYEQHEALPKLELESIGYHPLTDKALSKISVCTIDRVAKPDEDLFRTPKDHRLGTVKTNKCCATCHKMIEYCPGHFGRIDLPGKIIHPLFIKEAERVLKCVCLSCSKLKISEGVSGIKSLTDLASKSSKMKSSRCSNPACLASLDYTVSVNPSFVTAKYDDSSQDNFYYISGSGRNTVSEIFARIEPRDLKRLGFKTTHPSDYLIGSIPVSPICTRPAVFVKGRQSDHFFTVIYNNILSAIAGESRNAHEENAKLKEVFDLYSSMINSSSAEAETKRGEQRVKSIKEEFKNKEGIVRGNMLGKRCDYSARSVIGCNPNIQFGQFAMPIKTQEVSVPRVITEYNLEHVKRWAEAGEIFHFVQGRNLIIYSDEHHKDKLMPGLEIARALMNGDKILINRQPTLHKQSMLGGEVLFQGMDNGAPGKVYDDEDPSKISSMAMHLSQTTGANADFDGDEANVHILQLLGAMIEAQLLMNVKYSIISYQDSAPVPGMVYNAIIGCYLLSMNEEMSEQMFMEGYYQLEKTRHRLKSLKARVNTVNKKLPKKERLKLYSGKTLFSLTLPEDLWYEKDGVVIRNGVLVKGKLKKSTVGGKQGSIVQSIYKWNTPDDAADFITDANFVSNWYLLRYGLTVSLVDCQVNDPEVKRKSGSLLEELNETVMTLERKKEGLSGEEERAVEMDIVRNISNMSKKIDKLHLKTVREDNPIVMMAKSGTKSDLGSMAGMIGVLGQQYVGPARPPKNFSGGKRWLPLFKKDDTSIQARGFSTTGFYDGLDVASYFAQSQGGRVGLADTAVRTADIGAAQRSNGKAQENLIVNYDGSVRNGQKIVQFSYGFNLNPTKMVKYKDTFSFINLDEAVGRVNYQSKPKKVDFSKLVE